MASSSPTKEAPDRKRVSIPPVDASVREWWEMQHDASLSVRMLIRAEIERNGFTDVAHRPVAQQPRRGRPPGSGSETAQEDEGEQIPSTMPPAPAAIPVVEAPTPAPIRQPELVGAGSGMSPIDAIMNS